MFHDEVNAIHESGYFIVKRFAPYLGNDYDENWTPTQREVYRAFKQLGIIKKNCWESSVKVEWCGDDYLTVSHLHREYASLRAYDCEIPEELGRWSFNIPLVFESARYYEIQ